MTSFTQVATLAVLVTFCCDVTRGHVALSYPPARTYSLDFLDNARTTPPCGQPRGSGPVTNLPAGSNITVTWYLGYAHAGGYLIEILTYDSTGAYNISYTLSGSPGNYVGANQITAQSFNVSLPPGFTCTNCTIRLVRQALNWGPYYIFWSCSDVNIVPANNFVQTCSGNGRLQPNGTCSCQSTYSGSVCQYQDECARDADCGNGRCLFVTPYNYPQLQCYCEPGWFGLKCNQVSPLTSTQFNPALYMVQNLTTTGSVQIFYRILTATNELEAIVQAKTSSFIGLGWKPRGEVCVTSTFGATAGAVAEGSSVPEGSAVPEGASVAVPEGSLVSPSPVFKASAVPEGGAVPEGSAIPEGSATPEGSASAEPNSGTPTDESGMDCTDMTIGMAMGSLHRVRDYYSLDRSTPRLDDFYGGVQTLTAAIASTVNGVTTVMFRKPVTAVEKTDLSIVNDVMTVIWSFGQPPTNNSALGDFYRQDELKYHDVNRGIASINFYTTPSTAAQSAQSYSLPTGCVGMACSYSASWSLDVPSDIITFTIIAMQPTSQWIAIGFGQQQIMEKLDVYYGFINSKNQGIVVDAWVGAQYTPPVADKVQSLKSSMIAYNNGMLTMTFSRLRNTGDAQDWAFTDTSCYFFMYPVGGGTHTDSAIYQHTATPIISSSMNCIKAPSSAPVSTSGNNVMPASTSMPIRTLSASQRQASVLLFTTFVLLAATLKHT